MVAVSISFTIPVDRGLLDEGGLSGDVMDGKAVLSIPSQTTDLQLRLMVCAYMKEAGHRGTAVTLQQLEDYCYWSRMDAQVTEFMRQCLHCVDSKENEKVPRPLGKTVHGGKAWGGPT